MIKPYCCPLDYAQGSIHERENIDGSIIGTILIKNHKSFSIAPISLHLTLNTYIVKILLSATTIRGIFGTLSQNSFRLV
jgi:hypothetical protein